MILFDRYSHILIIAVKKTLYLIKKFSFNCLTCWSTFVLEDTVLFIYVRALCSNIYRNNLLYIYYHAVHVAVFVNSRRLADVKATCGTIHQAHLQA